MDVLRVRVRHVALGCIGREGGGGYIWEKTLATGTAFLSFSLYLFHSMLTLGY